MSRVIIEYDYKFVDKQDGREVKVKAPSAELATLRAWRINPNLTFRTIGGSPQ